MQFDLNIDLFFKKDVSALEGQPEQAAATIRPTERPELPAAEWFSHKLYTSAMLSNTEFSRAVPVHFGGYFYPESYSKSKLVQKSQFQTHRNMLVDI